MKENAELQHDVIADLASEPILEAGEVGVIAKDGVVTLTGTVASIEQKLAAAEASERVPGVRAVVDEVCVKARYRQSRTDEDLAQAVVNTLTWSSRIPSQNIHVKVSHGWITLKGTVNYKYERKWAEEAISDLAGSQGVTNLIEVKPAATPADIKSEIEDAFQQLANANLNSVAVEVQGKREP